MNDKILTDLQDSYGILCKEIIPVEGGWLNKKWKVSTDHYDLLIKQYSHERYNKKRLNAVESALQRQIILEKSGIPCPHIWQYGEHIIRNLNEHISYMVMEFCPGTIEQPDTITISQMKNLGFHCARMHTAFSKLHLHTVTGFPINSRNIIDALWTNYYDRLQACSLDCPDEYKKNILSQEPILKQIKTEFFERLPSGIAHEDFTPDNILFHTDCVSAIIDFDRNQYTYTAHDIGRAILSLALEKDKLNNKKVNAFLEGYVQHSKLTLRDIADALRLCWYIEIPWWINLNYFDDTSVKVSRFQHEMFWLTDNWFNLDSIVYA